MEAREGMRRAKVVVRRMGVDVEQDANRGQAAAGGGRSDSAAGVVGEESGERARYVCDKASAGGSRPLALRPHPSDPQAVPRFRSAKNGHAARTAPAPAPHRSAAFVRAPHPPPRPSRHRRAWQPLTG
jgi:hypothetical protein